MQQERMPTAQASSAETTASTPKGKIAAQLAAMPGLVRGGLAHPLDGNWKDGKGNPCTTSGLSGPLPNQPGTAILVAARA